MSGYAMAMPDLFAVLADPTRRRMLELVSQRERAVGELVDAVGISQPGVSKHLRVLHEAGLVRSRAHGKHRLYRMRATPLREVETWIARFRPYWDERLDDLEAHLNRKHGGR
jgi:DNA-binding transcriptional ArsR family regulator